MAPACVPAPGAEPARAGGVLRQKGDGLVRPVSTRRPVRRSSTRPAAGVPSSAGGPARTRASRALTSAQRPGAWSGRLAWSAGSGRACAQCSAGPRARSPSPRWSGLHDAAHHLPLAVGEELQCPQRVVRRLVRTQCPLQERRLDGELTTHRAVQHLHDLDDRLLLADVARSALRDRPSTIEWSASADSITTLVSERSRGSRGSPDRRATGKLTSSRHTSGRCIATALIASSGVPGQCDDLVPTGTERQTKGLEEQQVVVADDDPHEATAQAVARHMSATVPPPSARRAAEGPVARGDHRPRGGQAERRARRDLAEPGSVVGRP